MPVRISARSLGPMRNDCHQLHIPGVASFLLLPENQAEYVRNQRQACGSWSQGR
jgi:hypothetical protein